MKRSYAQPYARKNPSGQKVYVAPVTDPRTGKRGYAGTHKTKKEARAAQDSYYRSIGAGLESVSVEQYVERYVEDKMWDKQASTKRDATYRLNHYVVPAIGHMTVSEVRRRHV